MNRKKPIVFFDQISVTLPKKRIYYRLGFAEGKTQVSSQEKEKTEQYIAEAFNIIKIKGAALRLPIEKIDGSAIFFAKGSSFESSSLLRLLTGCREIFFMGATGGKKIMQAIAKKSQGEDITASVVYDAVASEMVDSALDWIIDYSDRELRRENKVITKKRFSAGYGDLSLENQKTIFEALDMGKLGVSLTKSFMLIPEKSVTAVAGIKDIN